MHRITLRCVIKGAWRDDTLTPMSSSMPYAGRPARRRPAVLDASRTALIPLRPLTIGEILDGAFLIVRRNVRLMLGLPLVVAGGTAIYVLFGVGLWLLLGNTTARTAQIALTVVMGLVGLLLLQQCLVWMTAILSRVSLQTVLGPGFAPSTDAVTLRSSLPLFWPVLGLSLLQYLLLNAAQTALTLLYYGALLGVTLAGVEDDTVGIVVVGLISLLTFGLAMLVYSYLSLTVPALSTESRHAPAWIGKPGKPTTVVSSFGRAFGLVGKKNLVRVALLFAGMFGICVGLVLVAAFGAAAILYLFASSINADILELATNPWTVFGLIAFSVLVAMSAVLAYVSAVQTLLYLDLRMRREGLDLAMRFDCMPVPQPAAPPLVHPQPWGPPPLVRPQPWGPPAGMRVP